MFKKSFIWLIHGALSGTSTPGQSGDRGNCNEGRASPHSLKLQHYWSFTIRWLSNYIQGTCLIWPTDRTLTGTSTASPSGHKSNGNEWVLNIPKSSRTEASPLDGLVSYPGHLFGGNGLIPLQRCSQSILQPQPTRLSGKCSSSDIS